MTDPPAAVKAGRATELGVRRGFTLVGSPGVGKTMFAKSIANHLATFNGSEASFIDVKPGSFRGMFYGQAESRIRELFAVARAAQGIVVIFLDELDSYGSRGEGIGQDIDGRVLGALLSEIDGLERAMLSALSFRGDAVAEIDAVLAEHPQFVMGHVFKAAWLTQAMETRIYGDMVAAQANAAQLAARANNRELGHLTAIHHWVHLCLATTERQRFRVVSHTKQCTPVAGCTTESLHLHSQH